MEKDQEMDKIMAKIMKQLVILSKYIMGASARSVKVVDIGFANPEEAKFEALYNEVVNFLDNQGGGYRSNYTRQGGNQGWNMNEGWKDHEREWRDHNPTWKEREGEKDRYVPPHEHQKPKDSEGVGDPNGLYLISFKPETTRGMPSDTMANPKNEVEVWKVYENFKLVSQRSIRRIVEEVGMPDLNCDSRHFQIGVCKTR
ncbi:hypothetical protein MTR67_006897 [Solanum verrucosum]|uniref:Uncharacterized protein n=1 Tax=Solanum verrucosum TaxID=315347 RepID=A0AAF0PYU7_SOLVR|nr:hypothetical protein MTR67_006897 [Solanum verrucosum]